MDDRTALRRIKELLLLQQEIVLAGGVHTFAPQYRAFVQKRKAIFKSFGLDTTTENIAAAFQFPFSFVYDILDYCSTIELCPYCEHRFIKYAKTKIRLDSHALNDYGRHLWSIQSRSECLLCNLKGMRDGEFPEIW